MHCTTGAADHEPKPACSSTAPTVYCGAVPAFTGPKPTNSDVVLLVELGGVLRRAGLARDREGVVVVGPERLDTGALVAVGEAAEHADETLQ